MGFQMSATSIAIRPPGRPAAIYKAPSRQFRPTASRSIHATRYLATTDPNTHLTTYQAVPLNAPVTVADPRLAEKNRTSLFIHYNKDNQPQSLRIQRIENQA